MNLKKYISIIFILIFTIACEKEVIVEIPVVKEPEKANVTLELNTTRFTTKGIQDHYTTEPTPEEKRIFNYSILLFDAAGQLETTLTAAPYNPDIPGSTGIEYTDALRFLDEEGNDIVVELTSGRKQVFALVNAPRPLLDEMQQFISRENATLQDFADWTLNVGDLGGMELITGTNEVPTGNERGFMMTCEHGMQSLTIYPPTEEGEVQNILLTVGRAMAKVSVASDLTKEQQPNGELTDITYKIVNNPYEMYIVPRFIENVLVTPDRQHAEHYFESPGPLEENYTPISRKGALTQVYCMEHAVTNPAEEVMTAAIVKGTYIPSTLYQANGTELYTGYKKGEHFWRIANLENGQRVSYEEKYYGEDPGEYLVEGQEAVKYPRGETFYTFYLRNEQSDSPYTVRRNSYYNIDITRVNHAGEEGEDKGDPDRDRKYSHIEISIKIVDWEAINQGAGV